MPKLKVPSVASKPPDKTPSLPSQLQLERVSAEGPVSASPPVKRGPRMKSCVSVKPAARKRDNSPSLRRQNGLKANLVFKEVFGGSDDEV